jgi:hypothetical protein
MNTVLCIAMQRASLFVNDSYDDKERQTQYSSVQRCLKMGADVVNSIRVVWVKAE